MPCDALRKVGRRLADPASILPQLTLPFALTPANDGYRMVTHFVEFFLGFGYGHNSGFVRFALNPTDVVRTAYTLGLHT